MIFPLLNLIFATLSAYQAVTYKNISTGWRLAAWGCVALNLGFFISYFV